VLQGWDYSTDIQHSTAELIVNGQKSSYFHIMSVYIYCWADTMAVHKAVWEWSSRSVKEDMQAPSTKGHVWQQEYGRDHQMLSWLHCDLEWDKHHVASLRVWNTRTACSLSRAWITGSMNQKVTFLVMLLARLIE